MSEHMSPNTFSPRSVGQVELDIFGNGHPLLVEGLASGTVNLYFPPAGDKPLHRVGTTAIEALDSITVLDPILFKEEQMPLDLETQQLILDSLTSAIAGRK